MSAALLKAPVLAQTQGLDDRAAAFDRAVQSMTAAEVIAAALREFRGRIAIVSSFGAESAALLHLVASADAATPVVFIDTGKHFVQTGAYREELTRRLNLKDVRIIRPEADELAVADPKGDLWKRDNDACCELRKVRPLARALDGFDAWFTGRKRMHGNLRSFLPVIDADATHIKVNPLARWSADELAQYVETHRLPPHPLVETGFSSIGCWPCTAPTGPGDDLRAGRWRGLGKTECGIHRA